ncbi:hypothetical protein LU298_05105 [Komagataeibacter intermedius]|uniref:Uncharacterized protein n=2 Tax=Komagataeibacter intermedius TaxID=66229 RepID=A0A0N1FQV6_9PROT|nr:hypothetical protein [Komagataeibacter intermedius]KPH88191.1 hypothetical protein GLUCOINTEAF2_0201786 [Komagataeibacter intermedius AF2]MCF3635878.1 hypothetical protein [Komagataeibacter intermedius]GAN86405.1 hypothetical protein Gain_0027_080 [Komagataeibacter intermedius TF2]GBQ68129.1 hypothetical protein AA0521_1163 [Komagataeibacter intermedius NRIC 0521]
MTQDRTRLTRNRVAGILPACLVSYALAHFMVIASVSASAATAQLGQIIALACLPALVVLCFSSSAGVLSVCMGGGLAVLIELIS